MSDKDRLGYLIGSDGIIQGFGSLSAVSDSVAAEPGVNENQLPLFDVTYPRTNLEDISQSPITASLQKMELPVARIDTGLAFDSIKQAVTEDEMYAYSWHCNVAMCAVDEGAPKDSAQLIASRFMQLCFGVNTLRIHEKLHGKK